MKVIFLDHDGVICLSTEWGGRYKKREKDNISHKQPNLESSDWKRWANVEEMGEYYESKGIIKKPIAFTPNLGQCNWYGTWVWSPVWDLEMTRVIEIKQYLHDHPEITHWVSIDDLDMGKTGTHEGTKFEHDWGLDNFVLTPKDNEGIKQSGIKQKILSFLL